VGAGHKAEWRYRCGTFRQTARYSAVSNRQGRRMILETVLSVAMLACFIWTVRYLLPKAIKEQDRMALTCVVLTAVLALVLWLLIGVSTRSRSF